MGPFLSSNMTVATSFSIFIVSLAFCALTAFLETTITTLRLFKLKELTHHGTGYQSLLYSLENNQNRVLTTILIAKNLADVTAATFGAELMNRLLGPLGSSPYTLWIGIAVVTALILVFGEITPKIVAKAYGERFFSSTLWMTNLIYYALFPLVNYVLPPMQYCITLLFGRRVSEHGQYVTSEKEICSLIDYIAQKGLMEDDKTAMLKSIFMLGKKPVREIMAPKNAIISVDVNAGLTEALEIFNNYQFSRLPTYAGSPENVIGMLHLKDVILLESQQPSKGIRDIVRPILFIPESTKVSELLKEFKVQNMHIALVIDEYGVIDGLVTLEDILEEIVGDIRDEYETTPQKIIPLKADNWLIDASIELKDLTDWFHITFKTEQAQTLAGFLNEQFQHLPRKGERLVYENYCFEIHQAGAKRVIQVLLFPHNSDLSKTQTPTPTKTTRTQQDTRKQP